MNAKESALYSLEALKKAGAQKAQCSLFETKKYELNVAHNKITLLRTTNNQSVSLKAIKDQCVGRLNLNRADKESLDNSAKEIMLLVNSSKPDACHDIPEQQPKECFKSGTATPDMDRMYELTSELLKKMEEKYPKTILEEVNFDFTHSKGVVVNSNGVEFGIDEGVYSAGLMFTSKDGKNISSFNYTGCSFKELENNLLDIGGLKLLLDQNQEQTHLKSVQGKFSGPIIVTPHCLFDFLRSLTNSLGDNSLISGSSPYKDKLGQSVAHKNFSLHSKPVGDEMASPQFLTMDGYKSFNMPIVDNGVLKNFILSQYGSKRTGLARSQSDGNSLVVNAGNDEYKSMLKKIKRGLLLCRFSGGRPSENGEFSGVAKNSYYIENGELKYPINETMVSGNFVQMFHDISGISKERINFGHGLLPWICFENMTISGA